MKNDATLTDVLDGLRARGYCGTFLVDDAGLVSCCACGATVEPVRIQLDGLRRLEGASDPSDMAAVLAVRCAQCAVRGSIVARYGPEAGPGDAALLLGMEREPRQALDAAEAASFEEPVAPCLDRAGATSASGSGHGRSWPDLMASVRSLGPKLDEADGLDPVVLPAHQAARRLLPDGRTRDALQGAWLGHPVHPALTDLPIGFWTSAFVLDLVGGRRLRPAADSFVALGVITAVPTILTGLADWSALDGGKRRTGAVHALANLTATALYARSFLRRRSGHRGAGIALGLTGAAAATVGGLLGGHLAFGKESDPRDPVAVA